MTVMISPKHAERLSEVADSVADERVSSVVTSSGKTVEVPAEVSEAFEAAIKALSGGEDLVIGTKDSFVTTQEAADFLGVSRPTMIRILDLGEVPYERPNSHRRIRLVDLVKFKAEHEKRRAALDDLLESSAKLDQFDGGFVKTR